MKVLIDANMDREAKMENALLTSKELNNLRARQGHISHKIGTLLGRSVINYFEVKKLKNEQTLVKEAIIDLEKKSIEDLIA